MVGIAVPYLIELLAGALPLGAAKPRKAWNVKPICPVSEIALPDVRGGQVLDHAKASRQQDLRHLPRLKKGLHRLASPCSSFIEDLE
jgi:hypothetical protein